MEVFGFLDILAPSQLVIIGVLAVLLFGKNLPEVGRSLGRGLLQIRNSIRGLQDEFNQMANSVMSDINAGVDEKTWTPTEEATAPKFVPPPASELAAGNGEAPKFVPPAEKPIHATTEAPKFVPPAAS